MTKFIGIVTLFPESFTALTSSGVVAKALKSSRVKLEFFNPRDYTQDKHRTVDEQPYGGGQGMLLKYEPVAAALDAAIAASHKAGHDKKSKPPIIFFSPQGTKLRQALAPSYAQLSSMILLSGCYEGIDERIITAYVDLELSIGDYILSSGDLAIMVFMNVIARLWESTLGSALSAQYDSFAEGLLEEPYYTRPASLSTSTDAQKTGKYARVGVNLQVPELLRTGNHAQITQWKRAQSLSRTWRKRPDLLADKKLSLTDKKLLLDTN